MQLSSVKILAIYDSYNSNLNSHISILISSVYSCAKCQVSILTFQFSNYNSHLKYHLLSWNLHHNKVLQQPVWNYARSIFQCPLICSMQQVIDCYIRVLCFLIVINNLPSPSWYKDSDEEGSLFADGSANSCSSNQTSGDIEDKEVNYYKQWHDLIIHVCLIFQVASLRRRIQVLEVENRSLYRKIDDMEKKIAEHNKVNAKRSRTSHLLVI